VSGELGDANLLTRACWEAVGPLAETFFAYYEEVDYCLRARAAGFRSVVVPAASVRHAGFRGFAGGFTPLAAYLKARNLPLVARRHAGPLAWMLFAPTYGALMLASALTYLVRGGRGIVPALARGVADALRARSGPPPRALLESVSHS
jgi:GT2 family glycosyltransferase